MKEKKVWENAWRIAGYDELRPEKSVVDLVLFLKRKKVKRILDLGCGTGRNLIYLIKQGFSVVGVDISPTALKLTKEWLKKEKLKKYSLVGHDMLILPFKNESFDAVISIDVIHHNPIKKIEKTVNEIRRVLRDDGLVLIRSPSTNDRKFGFGKKLDHNTYLTPGKITKTERGLDTLHHFFDKNEIKKLFSKFKIIKVKEEREDLELNGKIKKSVHWVVLCQKN